MATEFSIRSLSTLFISYDKLTADWRTYRKDPERYIHRFISINQSSFRFLGVRASYTVINYQSGLLLTTSQYVGAAPLLSPITGTPLYDLNIIPMYGEKLGNIISLLGHRLAIEFSKNKLSKPMTFRVPIYFSCIEYMQIFEEALQQKWTKFDSSPIEESTPNSSTDWGKYAVDSIRPERKLIFTNTRSYHTPYHKEWMELTGLLKTVIETYNASCPPISVRSRYESMVQLLREYTRTHPYVPPTSAPMDTSSDPPAIKNLKEAARRFLNQRYDSSRAWRIQIAEVFERFVQYIVEEACRRTGWKCICNPRYSINNTSRFNWTLSYIEPDIVISKGDQQCTIDAKYKSHMYNRHSNDTDSLKSSFREDYHQILAYSSFTCSPVRRAFLIYPAGSLQQHSMMARSSFSGVIIDTKLIGIPFTAVTVKETIKYMSELL